MDGGRSFPLRITHDLSDDADQFLWRVPSLPTAHGRLALRAGDDGEPGEERIVFMSEEFSIESETSWGAEPLCRAGAQWRTEEAARGNPARPLTAGLHADPPESLRAMADSFPAADRRPTSALRIASFARESRVHDFAAASAVSDDAPLAAFPAVSGSETSSRPTVRPFFKTTTFRLEEIPCFERELFSSLSVPVWLCGRFPLAPRSRPRRRRPRRPLPPPP